MPRVKRGVSHVKRRKNILADVKGYKWGRKNLIKLAQTARTLAGAHAYTDRRKKKRDRRALWQIKISAFVREQGISYSKFMGALKAKNIDLDRKVLADLAVNNKSVLEKIVATVKK
ncbi:MAG: 50S ribosomal protein L20 [Candidatus Parcubacteria bacterium]|jgi:large subunit ribosomal protein L20|nr:MAG: 50S ribosomal protein L20 [Candidatus Parcubacteria bacterium]